MRNDAPRNGRVAFQQGWKQIACPFGKDEQEKRNRWLREWDDECSRAWEEHRKTIDLAGWR